MGFFNNLKDKSKQIATTLRDGTSSSDSEALPVVMEWDKIYVEIDNDANGMVSNKGSSLKGSPTQRRSGRGSIQESASQSMYNDSKLSTFESRSYDVIGNQHEHSHEDSTCTPNLSNVQSGGSKTFTSGAFTQNVSTSQSSQSEQTPIVDVRMLQSADEHSQIEEFSITKDGKCLANNHFANAQLMRWKQAAEEGPCFIRCLGFLASIAAIFTTLYPLITDDRYWSVPSGICAFHTTVLCSLIIIFEIRVFGIRNPMNLRAKLRHKLVRHFNILRLVWGRGLLQIFAGTMNIAMYYNPYDYYTGGMLIALGLLNILMGAHAAFNLERLRLSLTDQSYLWSKFGKADSDSDNAIGIDDFSNLIWSLGLELDDSYTYRAFREIDHDSNGRISFKEFKLWWIASQDDDGTIVTMDYSRVSMLTKLSQKKVPDQISV